MSAAVPPLEAPTREQVVAAIEDNLFALAPHYRLLPDAETGDDAAGLWAVTSVGFPFFNSVFRTRVESAGADAAVARLVARARRRRVPLLWWTGPQTRPATLGDELLRHGFVRDADAPGMALDLARLAAAAPGAEELEVERVGDRRTLETWVRTFASGFGIEPEFERPWVDWLAAIGLGAEAPFEHLLAHHQGLPVATVSTLSAAGVAGIYNVATVPAARRRGWGREATRRALERARARGERWAILHASRMGVRIYRSLGFREHCRVGIYFWSD